MKRSPHSRYATFTGVEGEYAPGSRGRVLRNKLGIRKKSDMDAAEYEALVTAQETYLDNINEETFFTANLLCEMHRDWLDYGFKGRGSRRRGAYYLEAVKKGYGRDYADLTRFFLEALTRGAAS